MRKESLTRAVKRLTPHGIASLGPEETKKVSTLLAQETPPPLPPRGWKERGKNKETELDLPTFTERIRDTAIGIGADAFGTVYEHYKPLLADHAAVEALGRFAYLIATAQISERLCEAMACTSLVEAKSGTKGKLRPLQTGTKTTGGSYTGGARRGKLETNSGAGAVHDSGTSGHRTHGAHNASLN